MLRLSNLTLARGANRLLEGASLTVHVGQRVGIVGPNGVGKSTLFALLRGEVLPEAGEVELPKAWTIAHVLQETPAVDALRARLRAGRRRRAAPHRAGAGARARPSRMADGHAIAELHHRYETIGGYAARSRAAALLAGSRVPRGAAVRAASPSSPAAGACGSTSRRR